MQGVPIGAHTDVLTLMFADDVVFLADSIVKTQKIVSLLDEYVNIKGLSVNVKKTQLVICKPGRQSKNEKPLTFENNVIETVSSYTYLGIEFANSALGLSAVKQAVHKARIASGAVLSILCRARSDCFMSNVRVFESIVKSTLLSGSPVWSLRYIPLIEAVQSFFFKRILRLPVCTPTYMLHLELNLCPLEITIFALSLEWIIKVLKMDQSRLPSICMRREIYLFLNKTPGMTAKEERRFIKFNWVCQFNEMLDKIGMGDMWLNLNATHWEGKKHEMIERLTMYLREKYLLSLQNSSSMQLKVQSGLIGQGNEYLRIRLPWVYTCAVVQTKLANNRFQSYSLKGSSIKLSSDSNCKICNCSETNSVIHLIVLCPIFDKLRRFWLPELVVGQCSDLDFAHDILVSFLWSETNIADRARRLYCFCFTALQNSTDFMLKYMNGFDVNYCKNSKL